jgi:beta-lactam-binding protein with PASTA domain
VVSQDPRSGGLSAGDSVTIWVSKAEYGMLPNFVGSGIDDVQREAARLKVRVNAKTAPRPPGSRAATEPKPGVAVARGMRVTLVVGDGSRT